MQDSGPIMRPSSRPSSPLVSAIVAAYNEERRIGECLESLLDQTYSPIEIIVANDGSRDATSDVARRYPGVALLDLPHRGKGPTLNTAVDHARGDIVIFADADLLYERTYVAALVDPIVRGECDGTCHATESVANPGNRWSRCLQFTFGLPPDVRVRISDEELAAGSAIFRAIRRRLFVEVRGFEDTGYTDDATLAPKLGFSARFVRAASCSHYNPETLGEIFGRGRWAGKSYFLKYGARSLARLLPPLALARASRLAWQSKMWAMVPYALAEDTGALVGVAENAIAKWRPGSTSVDS
jgi:glycosyltransferase involved in cell wall biosynthesis